MRRTLLGIALSSVFATTAVFGQITNTMFLSSGVPYLIANPLDHTGGNNLVNVFGNQLPDFTEVLFWNGSSQDPTNLAQLTDGTNYVTYIYDSTEPNPGYVWY